MAIQTRDNFDDANGFSDLDSYVNGSASVSTAGELQVTANSSFLVSAQKFNDCQGYTDALVSVRCKGKTALPQFHMREASQGNFLVDYIDNDEQLKQGRTIASAITVQNQHPIASFDNDTFYRITSIAAGNGHVTILQDADDNIETLMHNVDVLNNTEGQLHGLGANSGTATYGADFVTRMLPKGQAINIVVLGDSNVAGFGLESYEAWPEVMTKKRLFEGQWAVNEGTRGS